MERAAATPELLDGPLDDLDTLQGNLRDLRRINLLLGGTRLSRRAVQRLLSEDDDHAAAACVLDVGTGAADIAVALRAAGRGRRVEVVAVDNRREVLDAARSLSPSLAATDGLELAIADGRDLPFPDGAFDVAHASLVIHHLEPGEAIGFLCELKRVSRRGVVVNDLVRGRLYWAFAWLGARLITRNRFTRHDGPLSVRRAYTLPELRALLLAAGLRPRHVGIGLAGHRVAIAAAPGDE
jgi:ubiquinone/menaquinone biosynthesis C-methylase UbiE